MGPAVGSSHPTKVNGGCAKSCSAVPGRTVLRSTAVYEPVCARRAEAICSATRWTALTSSWPLARPGVPTQMSASSLLAIASLLDPVARSLPARTSVPISSSRPGSTTGDDPALIVSTFAGAASTPTTSWPALARQAALTEPTYPRPNTLICTTQDLRELYLEPPGDLRPGELLLDQPAARLAERASLFGMSEERDDRPRKVSRFVHLHEVPARREGKALGSDGRGDHRLGHRERLEDLEPRSTADSQRDDVHCRLRDVGPHVLHGPGDADPGVGRGGSEPRRRISSDHRQRDLGHLPANQREGGLHEAQHGLLVGIPVHRPGEDEGKRTLGGLARGEVGGVDARRHGADLGSRCSGGQGRSVRVRHGHRPPRPRARPGLVPPHLAPLELEQSPAPDSGFAVAQAFPDQVLDVV